MEDLVQEAKKEILEREMLVRKVNKEIPEPMVYRALQDCQAWMEDLDCQVLDYLVQEAKREMLVRKVNKEIPEPMV